jgi:hypothetical protein
MPASTRFAMPASSGFRTAIVRTIRCLPRGLKEQGSGTFADIELARYGPFLPVPYWDWMDRHEDAARILAKDGDTEDLKFVRPLLRDVLRLHLHYLGNAARNFFGSRNTGSFPCSVWRRLAQRP